ncbi:MAG TPA: SIS domain-containing protein [Candidatus Limnocylindrales bacterium]|nr:SIS domain-containing protein [Candidatus Limnocylindrales bacterium]
MTPDDRRLDPDAPLAGPPDPWAETDMPTPRHGPPWHMTEMIEAEPAIAVRILERLARDGSAARLAEAVVETAEAGDPVAVVGCGTSEHGARAVATILGGAMSNAGRPRSIQAFEAGVDTFEATGPALVIGVSHEGATWATMLALETAREGGAATALITVSGRAPAAELADIVLETGELDTSWCHTVGYLSPIVAAIAITGAARQDRPDPEEARALLHAGLEAGGVAATEAVAAVLARAERIVVIGSGTDRIAARELTLKIEEGTHIPAAFRDVETLLHGHLAGMDASTAVVAIAAEPRESDARARRLVQALRAAAAIGVPAAAILTADYDAAVPAELLPAGRIVLPGDAPSLGRSARALLATAVPLQLLTERIARVRGVNPDPIRRDDARYLRAAEVSSPTS